MRVNTAWKAFASLAVLSMMASLVPLSALAMPVAEPVAAPVEAAQAPASVQEAAEPVALYADGYVNVRVVARPGVDLSKYGDFIARRIPDIDGGTVYYGRIPAYQLDSLSQFAGVMDVLEIEMHTEAPIGRPDPEIETTERPSQEEVAARLTALRDNPPEPVEQPEVTGWWDVSAGGHNAVQAWDAGYTGAGVALAVNDTGVDMAHPDFWGTEHRYENISGDSYYGYFEGWPVALSPFSNYLMAFDLEMNGELTSLNTFAYGVSNFADTSFTGIGDMITFHDTSYRTSGTAHPLNPVYHIGYHPDWALENFIWGERIAVLVVDEDGNDLYDTVYVDLNDDHDFRNDKPVRQDTYWRDNYVQGADELSWWDADLDGYPDVSGGMLYYIADGEHCPPFFDVYFGCSSNYTGYYDPPESGDLVAFMYTNLWDSDHGQLCASSVVAQGNINGAAPDWKPDGMGGLNQGPAVDSHLVPVGDIYLGFFQSVEQAWWFQALGYDGVVANSAIPGGDDGIQASSNSFGPWYVYEDGWEEWGRIPTYINYEVNPFTAFFMSAGNTGPGYGTTGAPQSETAIQVGSSNSYDSGAVYEPMASLEQMTFGDMAPYSSRGPSANNKLVPHLSANGSWGTAAVGLNEWGDGWTAWTTWGGTSRSAPLAMGGGAVVMDAFYQNNGFWPDWYTLRQLLMQGANHVYVDPMSMGTGYMNIGRSAFLAGGDNGVVVEPESWDVGDFEGQRYDGGFAHFALPGQSYTLEFYIDNVADADATVTVSDYYLEELAVYTYTLTTSDQALEDGVFAKPDYLIALEDIVGGPLDPDTVLLTAETLQTYDSFDPDDDEVIESYFQLNPYDWTDINGDGNLWTDLNGDGVVNWDEIDALEHVRLTRSYDDSLYQYTTISDPLNRVHDGIVFGLRHRYKNALVPTTELTIRVVLYGQGDWDLLDTSDFGGLFVLGAAASTSAFITFTAPSEYGFYQGAVQIDVSTDAEDYTTIVPVFANVLYQGDLTTDDPVILAANEDADQFYSNGYVRPIQDWAQGRGTGGDWRFFYLNQQGDPSAAGRQAYLVTRTSWDAEAPPADIDTFLLGPDRHFSSITYGNDELVFGSSYGMPGNFWGPYSLRVTGASESPQLGNGHWAFQTASGENVDYTIAPLEDGLHNVQIHSMRYDGETFREDYEIEVGYLDAPSFLEWENYDTVSVDIDTNMTFTHDVTVTAYGLTPVSLVEEYDQYVPGPSSGAYNACVANYWYTFTASNLQQLTVVIDNFSDGDDLDLFVLYDFDDDGSFNCAAEVIGTSGTGAPDPEVVSIDYPQDGLYQVAVDPYTVSGGGEWFDLFVTGMQVGEPFTLSNVNAGAFGPSDPISFDVANNAGTCDDETRSCLSGFVQVWMEGDGLVPLLNIPVHPRYTRPDLSQSSIKWVSDWSALPGDVLTYTIEVVNSATGSGTAVVTDYLPSGVTLVSATPGYTQSSTDTLVWDVPIPAGGGHIVSTDYDWFDISGVGTPHDSPGEWIGLWTIYFGVDDDDEGAFAVTLPFTYTFFGDDWTDVLVTANGEVTFDFWSSIASGFYSDGLIPGLDDYMLRLAVLPGDQAGPLVPDWYGLATTLTSPANSGVVYTYHDDNGTGDPVDDRFIIQWDEWMFSWRPCYYNGVGCGFPYPDNTYQLILYPDGRAVAQYAEINTLPVHLNVGALGDVGVEGWEDWSEYRTAGYTWQQTPASGLAWMYVPTPTATAFLTVAVEIDEPLLDGYLCNDAEIDNGYGQITRKGSCTVVNQAAVSIDKTVEVPTDPSTGDVLTYTVEIYNDGPYSSTFAFTDTLDVGLDLLSVVSGDFSVLIDGQQIVGGGWITAGTTLELVYTAEITSTEYDDVLCNDVRVVNGFGRWDYDDACVDVNEIDLQHSEKIIHYAGIFSPGAVLTYEVVVSNTGSVATPISIVDALPDGLTFGGIVEPVDAGYIAATHEVTAAFVSLAPDTSALLIYTATIDPLPNGTLVENWAMIVDGAGDKWWVHEVFAVENADFGTSRKDGVRDAVPGDQFDYIIYVVNSGWLSATAVVSDYLPLEVAVLTATLDPAISYDPDAHMVSWSGWLTQSETVELHVPVEVLRVPTTAIVNEAIITGGDDVFVTAPLVTNIWSADFYIEKWIDSGWYEEYEIWAAWDDVVTYTLLVANNSPISVPATISDTLPWGVVVLEDDLPVDVTYDADLHTVSWTGWIASGDYVWLEIPVQGTMDAALADLTQFNSFTLTDEWGNVHTSNMTQLHLMSTELEVLKWANVETAAIGDEIVYTVLIRNVGDVPTSNPELWEAIMVDELPDGVTYVPDSLEILVDAELMVPDTCAPVGGNIVCAFNVGSGLWSGNELRVRYAVTVDSANSVGDVLLNTVAVNDTFGIMSYGMSAVEVVAGEFIYLPYVTREY